MAKQAPVPHETRYVENAVRFPRRGGRVLCVHGAVSFHSRARIREWAKMAIPVEGGHACMSSWISAASSDLAVDLRE